MMVKLTVAGVISAPVRVRCPRRHAISARVVVSDVGQKLVLAEKFYQERKPLPCVAAARVVLRLRPEPTGHVIEPQRRARDLALRNDLLRLLALGGLYFFGFAPGRGFGAAVKAMTVDAEFEVPVWRARLAIDGHGTSFRVWLAMKASRSASVNILRGRFLPWPICT
jgi:hypothetical protein